MPFFSKTWFNSHSTPFHTASHHHIFVVVVVVVVVGGERVGFGTPSFSFLSGTFTRYYLDIGNALVACVLHSRPSRRHISISWRDGRIFDVVIGLIPGTPLALESFLQGWFCGFFWLFY